MNIINSDVLLYWLALLNAFLFSGLKAYVQTWQYPYLNPLRRTMQQRTRMAILYSGLSALSFGLLIFTVYPQGFMRQVLISLLLVIGLFMSYRIPHALGAPRTIQGRFPLYFLQDALRILPLAISVIALAMIG